MKQLNKANLTVAEQDREPSWCVTCDYRDKCTSCDATDFEDKDCGTCDRRDEE